MWTLRAFDAIVDPLNLWGAWCDFARDKRRRPDVATFALDADLAVHHLALALSRGLYRPGPYRLIPIRDPKRRVVAAASVRDRVVHHALHRVLAPRFNRAFIDQSYACLPGRGSHRALLRFLGQVRRYRYALQLDIRRYFYSIDRTVLRGLLHRHLPEAPLRDLLDRILESGADLYRRPSLARWLGWDAPMPSGRGLPIGNLTSQWWGNLYLDGLDHFACRVVRVASYQRYMDDFTVFGDDRDALVATRDRLAGWLARERGLELKHPDALPERTDGRLDYLGYRVTRAGVTLGPKARERLPARLGAASGDPDRLRACVTAYGAAWSFAR